MAQPKTSEQLFEENEKLRQQIAELRESESKFRSLFQDSAVGAVLIASDAKFLQVNRAFCDFLGYSEQELLGLSVPEITHPEDIDPSFQVISRAFNSGIRIHRFEKRYLHKNGQYRWGEVSSTLICNAGGKPSYLIAQVLDIDERKKAEAAIAESKNDLKRQVAERTADLVKANKELEIYRLFVQSATQGFGCVDLQGIIQYENPAMCRLAGEERLEDHIGKRVEQYARTADGLPDDYMSQVLSEGRCDKEGLIFSRQGKRIHVWNSSFLIRDNDGQPAYIATILTDITERKHSEEALRKEDRALKHLLQSSDHERQTISYEIHDGIAQYLTASLMQFEAYLHLSEKKPRDAMKAFKAAMDLLHLGHSEARRLISGVRPPVLDEAGVVMAVNHLVNEQNRDMKPRIEFVNKVKFRRLVPILENAIYRICQEGLSNVCQHSQSNRARISLVQHKHRLKIEIRDWGKGFTAKQIKTGCYGLEGIRERARLLGGRFCIQSALGKGSRLRVELPLIDREDTESNQNE